MSALLARLRLVFVAVSLVVLAAAVVPSFAQQPTAPFETHGDLGRRIGEPRTQRDFTPLGTRIRARTGASEVRTRLSGAATNSLRGRSYVWVAQAGSRSA